MANKQINIMVVGVSRALLSGILRVEMSDANIVPCADGQQALRYLEADKYDLITTSYLLPDMDGLELCKRIRQGVTHRFTPVILVSGDVDNNLLREGYAAGITDYFDKSRGYAEFVEFIKAATKRNAGLVGRVLYAEDSPTSAEIAQRLMEKHGLHVTHVATAEQALELLQRASLEEQQFDIVITDFFLKGSMTGGDLLHAIRAKYHYSQQELPVLIITSDNNEKKQTEVFHAGANDFVAKPIVEEVLIARIRSLLLVRQQYSTLLRQAEEMKHLAATDSLTGVHSKRFLVDNGELFLVNQNNHPVCTFLIDIDHFKKINDNLGHIAGDHVLIALGALLNQHFANDAIVVRFGGEEFSILLPRCTLSEACARAEALRHEVETLRPRGISVTISLGVAANTDHPDANLTNLLSLADEALYAAKNGGRNCTYVYTPQGPQRLEVNPSTPK